MNQRIIKLAEQAGLEYDFNPMLWLKYEKFAQLIVRECAAIVEAQKESLCDDVNAWHDRDYGYEQAVDDSVDMIKQHFGVKE